MTLRHTRKALPRRSRHEMLPTDQVDTSWQAVLMDVLACAAISFVLHWAILA